MMNTAAHSLLHPFAVHLRCKKKKKSRFIHKELRAGADSLD
jgi:hypothetical protein